MIDWCPAIVFKLVRLNRAIVKLKTMTYRLIQTCILSRRCVECKYIFTWIELKNKTRWRTSKQEQVSLWNNFSNWPILCKVALFPRYGLHRQTPTRYMNNSVEKRSSYMLLVARDYDGLSLNFDFVSTSTACVSLELLSGHLTSVTFAWTRVSSDWCALYETFVHVISRLRRLKPHKWFYDKTTIFTKALPFSTIYYNGVISSGQKLKFLTFNYKTFISSKYWKCSQVYKC